jgi:putative NIF3 family GTP cyclohydrolase 1 type 2
MKYSCLEYARGREPGQSDDAKGPPREEEARARDCLITGELMEHCLANGAARGASVRRASFSPDCNWN